MVECRKTKRNFACKKNVHQNDLRLEMNTIATSAFHKMAHLLLMRSLILSSHFSIYCPVWSYEVLCRWVIWLSEYYVRMELDAKQNVIKLVAYR